MSAPDPRDVIEGEVFAYCHGVLGLDEDEFDASDLTLAIANRLTAAGLRVVPAVDDDTREEIGDAVRHAHDTLTEMSVRFPSWASELAIAGRTLDALAAAYLDGSAS